MSINLRDQFAMSALQGLLSDRTNMLKNYPSEAAQVAYKHADAMLSEREKQHGNLDKIRKAADNMVYRPADISVVKSGEIILSLLDEIEGKQ